MIHEHLKTQRTPSLAVVYPTNSNYVGNQLGQVEYLRRNNILMTLAKTCGYTTGDIVRPTSKADFDEEGYFRVIGIANNWYYYRGSEKDDNKVEWPKNDNPKSVTIQRLRDKMLYECTTNYVLVVTNSEELTNAQTLGC
jgi:hypothetical protein